MELFVTLVSVPSGSPKGHLHSILSIDFLSLETHRLELGNPAHWGRLWLSSMSLNYLEHPWQAEFGSSYLASDSGLFRGLFTAERPFPPLSASLFPQQTEASGRGGRNGSNGVQSRGRLQMPRCYDKATRSPAALTCSAAANPTLST